MPIIPRILHQTWRTAELPPLFRRCRDGWLARHPAWEHRFYDDDDCRSVVSAIGGAWLAIYEALSTAIQRADLFRYLVVHAHGGVYADLDMECFRPIDALVDGAACVLSVEAHLTARRQAELGYARPLQLANCVFAAAPGTPFFARVLGRIERAAERGELGVEVDADVEDTTGPRMLTRCFDGLGADERDSIRVLPQILLMAPLGCPRVPFFGPPIHARHLTAGTWKAKSARSSLQRWWVERNRLPPLWP
jgi:mannosyltransferase OCH1-like enzyme